MCMHAHKWLEVVWPNQCVPSWVLSALTMTEKNNVRCKLINEQYVVIRQLRSGVKIIEPSWCERGASNVN